MSRRVRLHLLRVGACRHLACMADRGAGWRVVDFPALCGLIEHPQAGWILYDTGYAEHFHTATDRFPERLYRLLLPVELPPQERLTRQLADHGIGVGDIGTVVVSHYHGDHVAGLRDLPNACCFASRADTAEALSLAGRRWRATLRGQLPALLPPDFAQRLSLVEDRPVRPLPAWMAPWTEGHDLLGDGSLLAVPLPGHSLGQLGLFLPDADGRPVLLAGDACWSLPALRAGRLPAWPTLAVTARPTAYRQGFDALRRLALREPALALLPSHCTTAWEAWRDGH